MQSRPKIRPPLTRVDRLVENIGLFLLCSIWAIAIYSVVVLPDIIPIHYDLSGVPDNYGNKVTLLILPALATMIYFGLKMLNNRPHIFNYMTKITAENAVEQYTNATRLLRYLNLSIQFVFIMIVVLVYLTTIGEAGGIGVWFIPLTLAIILLPTIIFVTRALRTRS